MRVGPGGVAADAVLSAPLTVRPATALDASVASAILQEAASWLLSRGIEQWQPAWFDRDWVERQVDAGSLHLGVIGNEPVATLRVAWEDPEVWGEQPPDAAYIHSLAVRRQYAGAGPRMIDWAASAVTEAGRLFLRLDCWQGNSGLRRYYESLGFSHRGDVEQSGFPRGGHWFTSRYERRVPQLQRSDAQR